MTNPSLWKAMNGLSFIVSAEAVGFRSDARSQGISSYIIDSFSQQY